MPDVKFVFVVLSLCYTLIGINLGALGFFTGMLSERRKIDELIRTVLYEIQKAYGNGEAADAEVSE